MSKKLTTKEFIKKAECAHNYKYDYSLLNYINSKTKINIICLTHGIFNQVAASHLHGQGCPKCNGKNKTTKDIITEFKKIHKNKYNYLFVEYKGAYNKVKILCPIHGFFEQSPNGHLDGHGCSKCGKSENITTKIFIKRSEIIHNYKFDYSLSYYKNINTKVKIICPIHGIFEQVPKLHMRGFGCKNCNESKGEKTIDIILKKVGIKSIRQHSFKDCRNKLPLPYDFYLPELNTCIEFQGIQHYESVKLFGGEPALIECKIRDDIKEKYCNKNNINLIKIKHDDNIEKILKEKLSIIIKNNQKYAGDMQDRLRSI